MHGCRLTLLLGVLACLMGCSDNGTQHPPLPAPSPQEKLPPSEQESSFQGKRTNAWRTALRTPDPNGKVRSGVYALPSRFVNPSVRLELKEGGKEAVPVLMELVKDADEYVRDAAGFTLLEIGPEAGGSAFAAILGTKLTPTNPFQVRIHRDAVRILGQIGPEDEMVIPTLIKALSTCDRVSSEIPDSLAKCGPAAIPALADAMRINEAFAQERAVLALVKIGPAAVPTLAEGSKDKAIWVRTAAIRGLGLAGRQTPAAIEPLIDALKDDRDPHFIRTAAAVALGKVGPNARAAVPALLEVTKDQDWYVRRHAVDALKAIDPEAAKKAGVP